MRPKTDLINVEGTFSHWVSTNTEWIKENHLNKSLLIERLGELKDEGVSISDAKIKQLQERVNKAKGEFQVFSVFYHAAVSHLEIVK